MAARQYILSVDAYHRLHREQPLLGTCLLQLETQRHHHRNTKRICTDYILKLFFGDFCHIEA